MHDYVVYAQNISGGKTSLTPNLLTLIPLNFEMFSPSDVVFAASSRANSFPRGRVQAGVLWPRSDLQQKHVAFWKEKRVWWSWCCNDRTRSRQSPAAMASPPSPLPPTHSLRHQKLPKFLKKKALQHCSKLPSSFNVKRMGNTHRSEQNRLKK